MPQPPATEQAVTHTPVPQPLQAQDEQAHEHPAQTGATAVVTIDSTAEEEPAP